jgi:integrase
LRAGAKVAHHAALDRAEPPQFMALLAKQPGTGARALEFTILTAARTNEVLGARWEEIDLEAEVWTIPAERMKTGKEHKVALSERALAVLKPLAAASTSDGIFPGEGGKIGPLSNMTMLKVLKRMNIITSKVEAAYRRGDLLEKRRRLMKAWGLFCARASPVATTQARRRERS